MQKEPWRRGCYAVPIARAFATRGRNPILAPGTGGATGVRGPPGARRRARAGDALRRAAASAVPPAPRLDRTPGDPPTACRPASGGRRSTRRYGSTPRRSRPGSIARRPLEAPVAPGRRRRRLVAELGSGGDGWCAVGRQQGPPRPRRARAEEVRGAVNRERPRRHHRGRRGGGSGRDEHEAPLRPRPDARRGRSGDGRGRRSSSCRTGRTGRRFERADTPPADAEEPRRAAGRLAPGEAGSTARAAAATRPGG